jgi:hypothetical protein
MDEDVVAGDGAVADPQHTSTPDKLSTPQPETALNTALENRAAGVSTRWLSRCGHHGVPSASSPHVAHGAPTSTSGVCRRSAWSAFQQVSSPSEASAQQLSSPARTRRKGPSIGTGAGTNLPSCNEVTAPSQPSAHVQPPAVLIWSTRDGNTFGGSTGAPEGPQQAHE